MAYLYAPSESKDYARYISVSENYRISLRSMQKFRQFTKSLISEESTILNEGGIVRVAMTDYVFGRPL